MELPDRREIEPLIRHYYQHEGWKGQYTMDRVLDLRLQTVDPTSCIAYVSYTFIAQTWWAQMTDKAGADARTFELEWRHGEWVVTKMGDHLSAAAHFLSPTVVEREVIERQVVVIRCGYCRQLTPVDALQCRNCGATMS